MVDYQLLQAPYAESLIDELHAFSIAHLGSIERSELAWRLAQMPCSTVFVARGSEAVAGGSELLAFKIGYAVGRTRYHSWLGAVHPAWRRQGIALQLMERQHRWLCEQRYDSVETATVPSNLAMLSLNLRAGFRIIGNYCREDGAQRITLAKTL